MSDYIKRGEAFYAVSEEAGMLKKVVFDRIMKRLENIPSADVEPVIRCDNCIYKDSCCRNMFTSFNDYPVDLEWCSAGEMDGEEE